MNEISERVRLAAARTHLSPSLAQREAGNYPKGKFYWNGMEISIETPRGAIRSGTSRLGQRWATQMPCHYGYFRRTLSDADGDAVDVMVGPHLESDLVCVVDQRSPGGQFDEHKVVIGCRNVTEAKQLYLKCYSAGWSGLKQITPMTRQQFVTWLKRGNTGKPIEHQVSHYSRVEMAMAYARTSLFDEDVNRDELGRFAEKEGETKSGSKKLSFVPHPVTNGNPKGFETIHADAKKLDTEWSKDKMGYLPIEGKGQGEVSGRRERFAEFLKSGEPIQQPHAVVNAAGNLAFNDGRHRTRVLINQGEQSIPLTVSKADAARIRELVGSDDTGKPKPSEKPQGISGQQMGLFSREELKTGQKQLFNIVQDEPKRQKSTKPAERSLLEKIDDELAEKSAESKPIEGQKDLLDSRRYARAAFLWQHYARETRPSPTPKSRDQHQPEPAPSTTVNTSNGKGKGDSSWITIGGSHVHLGPDGKIMHGCPGLKGERVEDLIDESGESRKHREVRQAHAEARGLTGKDVTVAEAKRLSSANRIREHESAKQAAAGTGHSAASVLRALPDAHSLHVEQHSQLRPALNHAMKMTGLTPALARQWEDKYRDYSTWTRFDETSREIAGMYPELGMDPDAHDTPSRLWDLIRDSGARTAVVQPHSPEVARTAVEMLGAPQRRKTKSSDAAEPGSGDTSFDPDRFSRAAALSAQMPFV